MQFRNTRLSKRKIKLQKKENTPFSGPVLHTLSRDMNYVVQWTTRITETGITNLTRITNKMATSSDYLMKYFNGILAVLLE